MIVTVTMNAALDRTLTVPNFQRRPPPPRERGADARGRQGDQRRARAQAARRAGRRDGPRRRPDGHAHRRGADRARRSSTTSSASPTSRARRRRSSTRPRGRTRRSTSGGRTSRRTSSTMLRREARLPRRAGPSWSSSPGTLPRGVDDDFYAEAIRDLNRRGVETVLDSEGEPLRLGAEAEPFLVSPNRREAEGIVGQEFTEEDDFVDGARRDRRAGRAQRADHVRDAAAFALFREERRRAPVPRRRRRTSSRLGRRLRRRPARRLPRRPARGRSPEEALRSAVAAGAAATLEVGAGRFDPRDVGRLLGGVQVEELAAVAGLGRPPGPLLPCGP